MIFLHYADEHPMFTYAFFSPRTKRVLYRQDAIFLPTLFPMRVARQASDLDADGETLVTFRSPISLRNGSPPELSFGDWSASDSLPLFDDDITGFGLGRPHGQLVFEPREVPELPVHVPDHPGFLPSVVSVPIPASAALTSSGAALSMPIAVPGRRCVLSESTLSQASLPTVGHSDNQSVDTGIFGPRRSQRIQSTSARGKDGDAATAPKPAHRPTGDRWSYKAVLPAGCERYELKIDYVVMDQVCTWSHY
jgi:hypothetical protein